MASYGYPNRSGSPRRPAMSGFMVRLIIAAVIVGFTLLSYYSASQENPITGERQRVAMADPRDEIAMGLQAAPQMAAQHGGEHPDPQAQRNVDQVGTRLLEGLDRQIREDNRSNPYEFDFHLLRDSRTINAFALPGGQVFITAALYEKLQTEGQLAGVLGHEIGHVIARHGNQRLAKQKLTMGLTSAVGVAGGTTDAARMAQAVGQMINLKYGRDDELESDKWAVLLCLLSGYDPRAMLDVMDILDEASGGAGGPPEMMSTHPKPANRKAYIEQVIREVVAENFPDGLPEGLEK